MSILSKLVLLAWKL